jgi:hypothetical protein
MQRGFAHLLLVLVIVLVLVAAIGVLYFWQKPSKSVSQVANSTVLANTPQESPIIPSLVSIEYKDGLVVFLYDQTKFDVKQDSEADFFKRQNGNARKNFAGYIGYSPATVLGTAVLVSKGESNIDASPFAIWVFDNPDNLDALGWFGKYWYYPFNWGMYEWADRAKISPKNEATVAGQLVNYGIIAYQQDSPKYYLIPKNGKMFLIKVTGQEKLLESLKF